MAAPGDDAMEMFGPYRIEGEIGRGGMGEVHRAFDTGRERTVALKRLPADLARDGEYRERFRRESRLAARLSSPHVIPIHDFGEIDGRLYIDMRLVPGRDLAATIAADGPMDPDRVAGILRHIADALDTAHDAGMVHRDVKPSNILLSTEHGHDFAYLLDFGIVRTIGDHSRTSLTSTGAAIGTLAYMAPEVFAGDRVDRRVDVYALGCVLFEVLTGRRPFSADGPGLMYQHLHTPPPRLLDERPDLPAALGDLVLRAMAKNPAERPATAGELAAAVTSGLDARDRPAATERLGPPGAADRPRTRWRRRGVVLAVALLLLGGAATATVVGVRAATAPPPDTTTLRLAFPQIARLGPACRQDEDPVESTTAGRAPAAVVRCAGPADAEWSFIQWPSPADAGLFVADTTATRAKIDDVSSWNISDKRQGPYYKLADGTGALVVGGYDGRPFVFVIRGRDRAAVEEFLDQATVKRIEQLPA